MEEGDGRGGERKDAKFKEDIQNFVSLASFCKNLSFQKVLTLIENRL